MGAVFHSKASSDTPTSKPVAAFAAGPWGATNSKSDATVITNDHLIPIRTVATIRRVRCNDLVTLAASAPASKMPALSMLR